VDPVKGYTFGILIAQITTFLITVGCVMVDVSSPEAIMVELVAPDFITTFLLIRGHLAFYERVLACCFNNIASFFVEVAITSVVDPVKGYTFGIIGALLTTFLVTVGFVMVDVSSPVAIMVELVAPDYIATLFSFSFGGTAVTCKILSFDRCPFLDFLSL